MWACGMRHISCPNDGRGSTYSRLGGDGLWSWAGMIKYRTTRTTPRPNKSTKRKKREFFQMLLCFSVGLRKFLCLGPISPEVLPLDLETNTFATRGVAGVANGGHRCCVDGWRWAPSTKNAFENHILCTNSSCVFST